MTTTFPAKSGVDVTFTSGVTFSDGVGCLGCPRDERNDVDDRADYELLYALTCLTPSVYRVSST
jgi:hypothetical protein